MDKNKILEFAKKQGYNTIKKLDDWNGYEVYEPLIGTENEISLVGPPLNILIKNEKIRMSTVKEAFEHLRSLKK